MKTNYNASRISATKIITFVMLFAYILLLINYASKIGLDVSTGSSYVIGFLILFAGYMILASYSYLKLVNGDEKDDAKSIMNQLSGIGYGFLAAFFIGSHFYELTYTLHHYDNIATLGFMIMAFVTLFDLEKTTPILKFAGLVLITTYYILASRHYLMHDSKPLYMVFARVLLTLAYISLLTMYIKKYNKKETQLEMNPEKDKSK